METNEFAHVVEATSTGIDDEENLAHSRLKALCSAAETSMTFPLHMLIAHPCPPDLLSDAAKSLHRMIDETLEPAERSAAAIHASRYLRMALEGDLADKTQDVLHKLSLHIHPTCAGYKESICRIEMAYPQFKVEKDDLLVRYAPADPDERPKQRNFIIQLAALWRDVIELALCTSDADMEAWSKRDCRLVIEAIRCHYTLVLHEAEPRSIRLSAQVRATSTEAAGALMSFLQVGLPLWRRVQAQMKTVESPHRVASSQDWSVRRQAALWQHLKGLHGSDKTLVLEEPLFPGLVGGEGADVGESSGDAHRADGVIARRVQDDLRGAEGVRLQVAYGPLPKTFNRDDSDLLKQFAPLVDEAMPVATVPQREAIERIMATLRTEYPWAQAAVEQIGQLLKLRSLLGCRELVLPPLMLVGPPGTGKSRLARRLAELLRMPFVNIGMGGSHDVKMITGTARGWGGATPSPLLTEMLQSRSASVLVLLDEIDKCSTYNHDESGSPLTNTLLGLLEPETSSRFRDGFLQVRCDLSRLNYVATANSLQISKPLMSRFMLLHVPEPRPEDRRGLAQSMLGDLAAEMGVPREAMPEVPREIALQFSGNARTLRAALRRFMLAWAEETLNPARLH